MRHDRVVDIRVRYDLHSNLTPPAHSPTSRGRLRQRQSCSALPTVSIMQGAIASGRLDVLGRLAGSTVSAWSVSLRCLGSGSFGLWRIARVARCADRLRGTCTAVRGVLCRRRRWRYKNGLREAIKRRMAGVLMVERGTSAKPATDGVREAPPSPDTSRAMVLRPASQAWISDYFVAVPIARCRASWARKRSSRHASFPRLMVSDPNGGKHRRRSKAGLQPSFWVRLKGEGRLDRPRAWP